MRNLLLIPTFFNAPKIGSTPILLQEGADSFLTQELFGANVISQKIKAQTIKTIYRNLFGYTVVVVHLICIHEKIETYKMNMKKTNWINQ